MKKYISAFLLGVAVFSLVGWTFSSPGTDGFSTGEEISATIMNEIRSFFLRFDSSIVIVDDDGALSQADIHAGITEACSQSGNLHVNCKELVLPAGTFTLTDTVYISDDGNDGPGADSGEGVWGLKIRGAGGAYIQTPFSSAATPRCATTLVWDGSSAAPMIWLHGARAVEISDLCLVLDGDQDGTTGTPPASHGIVVTSSSLEISEGVTIRNVDIYGFSSSWANNETFDSICIATLPADFSGDPPYATSTQVDHLVVEDSRLECHSLFLGANGSSGTNGITFMNVDGSFSDYGFWAESTDLQIYSGKYSTTPSYAGTGDEANACAGLDAWIKIGSTSSDQAKTVSVVGTTVEGDCGEAISTVDATNGSDQRDSTTTLINTSINWGAANEDHVINYTHHGSLNMTGGYFGIRNGENYTTGSRSYFSVLPDTRTADTLSLRLNGAFLDSWTTGNIRVETNSQVDLIRTEEIANSAITNAKMADDAIGAAEMADADHGDISWSGGVASIDANAVALSTDTTGNYVATIADSGASEVTVTGSGSEGAAVTLAIASSITRDSELSAYTVGTAAPVDGSDACTDGDMWLDHTANKVYWCVDSATDDWFGVALSDTP